MGNQYQAVRDRSSQDRDHIYRRLRFAASIVRLWKETPTHPGYRSAMVEFGVEVERMRSLERERRCDRNTWFPAITEAL